MRNIIKCLLWWQLLFLFPEPNPSAYARSGNDQGASDIFSGTVYESIRSQSRQGPQLLEGDSQETRMKEDTIKSLHGLTSLSKRLRNMPEGTGLAIQEEDEKEDSLQEMSRAQRFVSSFKVKELTVRSTRRLIETLLLTE